jgi:hypothetical protein
VGDGEIGVSTGGVLGAVGERFAGDEVRGEFGVRWPAEVGLDPIVQVAFHSAAFREGGFDDPAAGSADLLQLGSQRNLQSPGLEGEGASRKGRGEQFG